MNQRYIANLVTRTIKKWLNDGAKTYCASLSFYFLLSLPALLIFSTSIGSIFLGTKHIEDTILNYLQIVADQRVINMINVLFKHIPKINSLSISALIGLILLLWSASNFFRQLKNFLERVWAVKPAQSNNLIGFVKDAIMSFIIVVLFGGLLVVGTIIKGVIIRSSRLFQGFLHFSPSIAVYAGSISNFLVLVLFFMLIYRILPENSLDRNSIFVGSLVTTILTFTGKYIIELYLTYSNPTSIYGVIGPIIGLFILTYYSSIMVTIGAEFTKIYSESGHVPELLTNSEKTNTSPILRK
jgi:membrane protein